MIGREKATSFIFISEVGVSFLRADFAEWCKKFVFDLIIHKFLNSKEISHENSVKSFSSLVVLYFSQKRAANQ